MHIPLPSKGLPLSPTESPIPAHGPHGPPHWPCQPPPGLLGSLRHPTPSFHSPVHQRERAAPRSLHSCRLRSPKVSDHRKGLRPSSLRSPLGIAPQEPHPAHTGRTLSSGDGLLGCWRERRGCPALAPLLCGLHRGIIKCCREQASHWAQADKNTAKRINGISTKLGRLLALFNPTHTRCPLGASTRTPKAGTASLVLPARASVQPLASGCECQSSPPSGAGHSGVWAQAPALLSLVL